MEKQRNSGALGWVRQSTAGLRLRLLMLIVSKAIFSAIVVLFALFCRGIIDCAVAGDTAGMMRYALCLAAVILTQLVLRFLNNNLEEYLRARLEVKLKSRVFASVLKKQYRAASEYHSGEVLNRLVSDVTAVCDGAVGILPALAGMAARLVCAFAVLVVLEPWFVLLFAVGGVLLFGITRIFRRVLKTLHKRVQAADGRVRAFLQEALESMLVIKVFGEESHVTDRADELQEVYFKEKRRRWRLHTASNAGMSFVFQIAYLCALVWCAYRLLLGTMSFGTLSAVLQLVSQVQAPLTSLSGFLPRYYGMLASAERLQELEAMPDEPQERLADPREFYEKLTAIRFSDVTFSYDRERVLEHASLTVYPGDFVAIMGRSGIGKSTLLKLLLDVFPPESGEIFFERAEGNTPANCATRPLFSYVPQGNFLFSGTIRENLTFAAQDATEEDLSAALCAACADGFIGELPEGLETVIGEHGQGLSEGQVQRIALARALLKRAPILLLDEATSALDEATEEAVLRNLRGMKDVTCIIVSHKRAAQSVCNRHVYIEDKKICEA